MRVFTAVRWVAREKLNWLKRTDSTRIDCQWEHSRLIVEEKQDNVEEKQDNVQEKQDNVQEKQDNVQEKQDNRITRLSISRANKTSIL